MWDKLEAANHRPGLWNKDPSASVMSAEAEVFAVGISCLCCPNNAVSDTALLIAVLIMVANNANTRNSADYHLPCIATLRCKILARGMRAER